MSLAYQVTLEDVENVLSSNTLSPTSTASIRSIEAIATVAMPMLNFELIEQSALYGVDLDEQTDFANDEIARQLRELDILAPLELDQLSTATA